MTLDSPPLSSSARPYVMLLGPTASGKSALAIDIARKKDGVIINADSMQVYADLNILTARPNAHDLQKAPHLLYGVCDGAIRCSAGRWLALARDEVDAVWKAGKLPILVGGTGLYMQAALRGISPIPDIPEALREDVIAEREALGAEAFHAKLAELDPDIAERLYPTDTQRVLRAMEVVLHTSKPLSYWQNQPRTGKLEGRAIPISYMPPRQQLYENIENRFDAMVSAGALAEVQKLMERKLDADLPVMKALGVAAFRDHLAGDITLEQAIMLAKRDTRRYAKRQMTWIRNNFISKIEINELYYESLFEKIFPKVF